METLAERLAYLMLKERLTQIGLARKAEVAPNNVQAILTGHSKRPAADIILPIARALGVSPEYLVFGEHRPITSIAEARERLGDMFMELMGLLNVAERHEPAHMQMRIAEAKTPYRAASQKLPVVSAPRAHAILERLRGRGALRELEPGESSLAMVVELPESAREASEVDDLFQQGGGERHE